MADLRFHDALLDRIRSAVPISQVVGQYVTWDQGKSQPGCGDMWACCPFHSERDPSFHVLDQDGIYKCFVCSDSAGDVFDFLVQVSGISFVEAVKTVAGIAGIDVDQPKAPQIASGARPALPPAKAANRPAHQPKAPKRQRQGKWTIFKAYDYEIDGVVQYQNVRIQYKMPDGSWEIDPDTGKPDKDFRQRRPSGLGDGSWLWGLKAGHFMRRKAGDDWRKLDETVMAEWGGGERLTMKADVPHGLYRRSEIEIAIAEGKTVLFLEGEKAVDASWDIGQPATCNSGGGENFTADMLTIFRGARVVASPDNDQQRRDNNGDLVFHPDGRPSFKGKDHAEQFCAMVRDSAAFVGMLELPGLPLKGDIVEWIATGGTAAQLSEMIGRLRPWRPSRPVSLFNALSAKDAIKFAAAHDWLVDDLIEAKGTFAFAGNSQSGKTFQVIELSFCVALGRKYWGRDVKQGLVVYQVGEGEDGFMKRLAGWMQDRGIDSADDIAIEVLPKKINLFSGDDDTNNLIKEAKALEAYHGIPLRMIVIDTYNKATRGSNEISGQDVGKINERMERIMTECNCAVGVVDHLSAAGRVRGHGSKTGDITNMIIVEKDEKKVDRNGRPIRRMRLDKNKDGENGGTIPFVLRQVVVGFREDGKAITTCVVEAPDGNEEELEKSGRLPLNQSLILQAIRDVIGREGFEPPHEVKDVPKGKHVVGWKAVMAELRRKWVYKAPESEPEQRERELQRIVADAGKRLQNNGYIDRDNPTNTVWWTGKTDRPLYKTRQQQERPPEQPGAGIADEVKQEIMDSGVPF